MLANVLLFLVFCLLRPHDALSLRVPLLPRTLSPLHSRANTSVSVISDGNTQYFSNIIVGGSQFTVLIDTGSSDLWITGNIQTTHSLGKTASVTYAQGQAAGPVNAATVKFSGETVDNQAFIYVQNPASTGIDTSSSNGIIGLGPSSSSNVRAAIGDSSGDTFLDNVFRQNTSTPNFITVLLGRQGDAADVIQGQLTIGEVVPGFENITNQPKVPVHATPLKGSQHWSGTIDGIIGPDGKNIDLTPVSFGTPSGKLVTIYDTGFSLPQVPRAVSDAIYGRVQGANFDTSNGWWTIPCDQEVNLTVVIGGQNYPIHPLDTSSSDISGTNGPCVGTFQPIPAGVLDGTFDAILGMGFLRNTYTSINFGDFIDGNPDNQGPPFVQLLSVTDPNQAHQDFVKTRLNGVDTTGDSAHALLPASQGQHSPESLGEKAKTTVFRNWPYIVAGAGLLFAGLLFLCCCFCRRRGSAIRGSGIRPFVAGPYRPLHEPAPAAAMDLHTMHPQGTAYATPPPYTMPPHGATYSDPYYRG